MKVGIDIRCLSEGRRTGVEEYTLNLLKNLFELDKKNQYVLFFNSFLKPKTNLELFRSYKNVEIKIFRYPNKILNFLFWYLNWPKIDKILGGADILFFPNIIFSAWSRKAKTVFTVHDLSFELYPETFSFKRRFWHWFVNPRKICQQADKIITVSDSSKNDIKDLYGIKESKIKTIYNGVAENFQVINRNNLKLLEVKNKYNLPYKFILYLGTIEPRKNIIGIIRAYNLMRTQKDQNLDGYKLVIAGSSGWKQQKILEEINNSPCQKDIIFLGHINEEDKVAVYNLASLFVYPSFFEGFGFPPLEAMKCGVPVVVSNSSSFPETIAAAGIMVDPDRPDEIFQAMKNILLNRDLYENLRKKGLEQVQKFNWQKTAKEVLDLINNLS